MKKSIVTGCLMLVLVPGTFAQEQMSGDIVRMKSKQQRKEMPLEERVDKQVARMTEQLALSPEQQIEWKQSSMINVTQKDQLHKQMKFTQDKTLKKSIRKQLIESRIQFDASIATILDDTQERDWAVIQNRKAVKRAERQQARAESKMRKE